MAIKKQKIKINGMHCNSCSMLIDGDLEDTKGVIEANTNYARQVTEVTFNDGDITLDKILGVIKKTGYDASL